jgi:NAD-dependent deacetylase
MASALTQARARLERAACITALTGAGISADSGVPTFRGADGLWRNFQAEALATPEAFARDPRLVWEWYDWRRALIATKRPNPGHLALAQLERGAREARLITQNVDGLHAAAGSAPIELHGSLWRLRCEGCGRVVEDRRVPLPLPPHCGCGELQRPDVVWFGEALNSDVLGRATAALACDVLLVVGTSGVVQPAASFASWSRQSGAFVIEINPDPGCAAADLSIAGRAAEVLPQLLPPA